jgi:hypothetical protein
VNRIAGWLGLGAIVLVAIPAALPALRYGVFDEDGPGPGLFPLLSIALILAAGLMVALEGAARVAAPAEGAAAEAQGAPTPGRMTALLWIGGVRLLAALAIAAAATLASHGLFVALLDVPLPAFGWR